MPKTLVCLHGWGASKASFTELRAALQGTDIAILTPDLPGFGDAGEPEKAFSMDDYAQWAKQYIEDNVTGNYLLLGHSHGGRIIIKMLGETDVKKPTHVFLCAAAGIRRPRHFKRALGLMLAKGGKLLFSLPLIKKLEPTGKKLLYKLVRVHDYENASEVMRKTLINVSSEDLRPLLPRIDVPTDIFWGEDDGMTPFADAKIMAAEIPNATLHAYKNVRHRVHRDRAPDIAEVIRSVS